MISQFSTTTITVSIVIFSIYLIKFNGELNQLRKGQRMNAVVNSNNKNNKSALKSIKDKACKLLTDNLKDSRFNSYDRNATYEQKMAKYHRDLKAYNAKYGRNRSSCSQCRGSGCSQCRSGGNCAYGQCRSGRCGCGGNCADGQCRSGRCGRGGNCARGQCRSGRCGGSNAYGQRGGGYNPYSRQRRGSSCRGGSCYRR